VVEVVDGGAVVVVAGSRVVLVVVGSIDVVDEVVTRGESSEQAAASRANPITAAIMRRMADRLGTGPSNTGHFAVPGHVGA
jgi:hypothetical protein